MASGILDIKRRIKSVKNTQKITKAVSLVATSKFGRIRPMVYKASEYFEEFSKAMGSTFPDMDIRGSLLYKSNNSDTDLYLIITSDSGLCGNYNANVINTALKDMHGKKVLLLTIGERGRNYFKRRGYETISEYVEIGVDPSFDDIRDIMKDAVDYYMQGKVKNVYIAYTRFYTPLKNKAQVLRMMPLQAVVLEDKSRLEGQNSDSWLFEPSREEVFEFVFPKYLNSLMYYTIINSIASEYSSRIISMDSSTRNASDILTRLQNMYNKARQSSITQEISEIVGGAEALKG